VLGLGPGAGAVRNGAPASHDLTDEARVRICNAGKAGLHPEPAVPGEKLMMSAKKYPLLRPAAGLVERLWHETIGSRKHAVSDSTAHCRSAWRSRGQVDQRSFINSLEVLASAVPPRLCAKLLERIAL